MAAKVTNMALLFEVKDIPSPETNLFWSPTVLAFEERSKAFNQLKEFNSEIARLATRIRSIKKTRDSAPESETSPVGSLLRQNLVRGLGLDRVALMAQNAIRGYCNKTFLENTTSIS